MLKSIFKRSFSVVWTFAWVAWAQQVAAFQYEDLKALIETQKVATIEGLLPLLPDELRASGVYMYKSRSLQLGSFLFPRVLLSTADGTLFVSFNGSPDLVPGNERVRDSFYRLEIIQFRAPLARYEMYEIFFPQPGESKSVRFSTPNPRQCLACHGADPRPIWEPFRRWPGAYGSDGGQVSALIDRQEPEMFQEFLKHIPSHPRYRALSLPRPFSTVELSESIGIHNFERIVRVMRGDPRHTHLKFAALAALACPNLSGHDYLPPRLQFPAESYSELLLNLYRSPDSNTGDWSTIFFVPRSVKILDEFVLPQWTREIWTAALVRQDPELREYADVGSVKGFRQTFEIATVQNHKCAQLAKKSRGALGSFY